MGLEAVINGGLSFAAVLILMVLNVPIGIATVSYTHLTLPTKA